LYCRKSMTGYQTSAKHAYNGSLNVIVWELVCQSSNSIFTVPTFSEA
jgi:hypothetical protein